MEFLKVIRVKTIGGDGEGMQNFRRLLEIMYVSLRIRTLRNLEKVPTEGIKVKKEQIEMHHKCSLTFSLLFLI